MQDATSSTQFNIMTPGQPALDFELIDTNQNSVRLSDYFGKKVVVLSFLRGFM